MYPCLFIFELIINPPDGGRYNPGIVIYVTIKARHVMQLVLIRTGTRQKNPERITTARIHANL
nr:MAG TPA: hypothetical protein [Caudoviricetes sp.]